MSTLVTILHVLVCLFLMLTVLLQQGKGGGMGGAFGGSNAGSVFGGAGASTFLRRLTATAATIFMMTSMVLAYIASDDAGDSLEKISASEADKRRRAKEAERRAFEGGDAGTTPNAPDGDAGVTSDPSTSTGVIDPATGTGTGTTGAEVPAEIPGAGSAETNPTTPPTAGSATTTPPAAGSATPPTAPVALPPGSAPVKPPAATGTATGTVKPPVEPGAGSADKPATPATP